MDIRRWAKISAPWRKKYLALIVSLGLLSAILIHLDARQIFNTILQVNLPYYLAGLGCLLVYLILKSKRWQLLLRSQEVRCSIYTAFNIYNIGSLYGLLTPGRVGDFAKVYHLSPYGSSNIAALWGILYDRLLDLLVLLVLNIFTLFFLRRLLPQFSPLFWLIICLLLAGAMLLISLALFKKLAKTRLRHLPAPLLEYAARFHQKFIQPAARLRSLTPREALSIILLTILVWGLLFTVYYIFALSLDIQIGPGLFIALASLAMLLSSLPISLSGIGVRDLSFILLLSLVGVDEHRAVSLSFLVLSTYIFSALIGAYALLSQSNPPKVA